MNSKPNNPKVIKVNSAAERKLWQTAGRLQNLLGRKVSLCEAIEFLMYLSEQTESLDAEILKYGKRK